MDKSKIHSFKLFIPTLFLPCSLIGAHCTTASLERNAHIPNTFSLTVSNILMLMFFYYVISLGAPSQNTYVRSFQYSTLVGGQKLDYQNWYSLGNPI